MLRSARRALLPVLLCSSLSTALLATDASASGCRAYKQAGFSLKVRGTSCSTGRAVMRTYFNDQSYSTKRTIEVDGYRWRCRVKTIRRSGYSPTGQPWDETIRGQVRCYRVKDQATAQWQFSGGGD